MKPAIATSPLLRIVLLCCMLLTACAPAIQKPADRANGERPAHNVGGDRSVDLAERPASACLARGSFPPLLPGLRYGTNAFLFHTDTERVLTLAKSASFGWVRQQIHWRDIEVERGRFVWEALDTIVAAARTDGFDLMLSVVNSPAWATSSGRGGLPDDPATLGAFLTVLAQRYRGQVAAYEIWNEPNLARENGGIPAQPAAYLPVLQAAYTAIKATDPCALVLTAPLAATATADMGAATDDLGFYEELYALDDGAFLRAADAVAVHPGGGPYPPDAAWPGNAPDRSHFYFRHIERIRNLMLRHGDQRQVWITEVGWSVSRAAGAPTPVSQQQQADYLVAALRWVRQNYPWVAAVFVWNLNFNVLGAPDDEKSTFGILNADWSPRPAYRALQQELHALRERERQFAPAISGSASHTYAWSFPVRGKMRTQPALAPDETIYIASDPGHFYALSPSGALRWSFDAPGASRDAPALAPDGTIYLADGSGQLTALQPDGTVAWMAQLRGAARGSPVYAAGRISIATSDGAVHAFDQAGQERWRYDLGAEATPVAVDSAGAVLAGTTTGELYKLSATGQVGWHVALGSDLWAAPALAPDGTIYAATLSGAVVAIDDQGRVQWRANAGAAVAAALLVGKDGTIYVAARDGSLNALAATDGSRRWRYVSGSDMVAPPVQDSDGTLYIGTDDERLLAINPDGTLRWQAHVRGMVRAQPAVGPEGTIYITTVGGLMYAFTRR